METLAALREAVHRSPHIDVALYQLGMALDRRGETAEGLASVRAAAFANPREPRYQLALGYLLANRAGAFEEAAEHGARALALDPGQSQAAMLLGWLYGLLLDRKPEGRALAARAIELNPEGRAAYVHLSRAWLDGDPLEAVRARVEAARPPRGRVDLLYAGLCTALMQVARYEDAGRLLRELVREGPANALFLALLGEVELVLGDEEAANAHAEQACRLDPSDDFVRNTYLTHMWRTGDHDRIKRAMWANPTDGGRPWWSADRAVRGAGAPPADGEVSGRTLLLKEMPNGYGDTIQCARLAGMLQARGARVILECRRPLRSLLETVSGAPAVVVPYDDYPPYDDMYFPFHLPRTLDWTWDELGRVPYIHVPAAGGRAWEARLRAAGDGVHVGVEWRPGDELTHRDNPYRCRAIALDELRPALGVPGTVWHALNVGGAGRRDLRALPPELAPNDLAGDLPDFLDTAAAMCALDVVVTVDTAAAHLAGALGRPTLLLLPYHADWRWGRRGEAVPWYPSVRTFRQPAPGDWAPVVRDAERALRTLVRSHEERGTVHA